MKMSKRTADGVFGQRSLRAKVEREPNTSLKWKEKGKGCTGAEQPIRIHPHLIFESSLRSNSMNKMIQTANRKKRETKN